MSRYFWYIWYNLSWLSNNIFKILKIAKLLKNSKINHKNFGVRITYRKTKMVLPHHYSNIIFTLTCVSIIKRTSSEGRKNFLNSCQRSCGDWNKCPTENKVNLMKFLMFFTKGVFISITWWIFGKWCEVF